MNSDSSGPTKPEFIPPFRGSAQVLLSSEFSEPPNVEQSSAMSELPLFI